MKTKRQVGQRWLWNYACDSQYSDTIIEVVELIGGGCEVRYVQILRSNHPADRIGDDTTIYDDSWDNITSNGIFTYLEGQDR